MDFHQKLAHTTCKQKLTPSKKKEFSKQSATSKTVIAGMAKENEFNKTALLSKPFLVIKCLKCLFIKFQRLTGFYQ